MKWIRREDTDSYCLEGTSSADSLQDAIPGFGEFWVRLFESVRLELAESDEVQLLVEKWPDSGRVIGHPIIRGRLDSHWPFAVQLGLPLLVQLYEALPDPDSQPEEFTFRESQLQVRLRMALMEAVNLPHVLEFAHKVQQDVDVRIFDQSRDDRDTRLEVGDHLKFD